MEVETNFNIAEKLLKEMYCSHEPRTAPIGFLRERFHPPFS
jgi:hypothetical protein